MHWYAGVIYYEYRIEKIYFLSIFSYQLVTKNLTYKLKETCAREVQTIAIELFS